jgi:transposase
MSTRFAWVNIIANRYERVAEVIRKVFGVVYHPAHVSRLVRALEL